MQAQTPSFTVSRDVLLVELVHAERVIERKPALPVLSHVLIEARADQLVLKGTDLDVSLQSHAEAAVSREGSVCLAATKLRQLVAAMKGDVTCEGLPHGTVRLRGDGLDVKVAGLEGEDFPSTPSLSPDQPTVTVPAAPVLRAIHATRYAVASVDHVGREFVRAARLTVQRGSVEMSALDGHRMAHYREDVDTAATGVEACLTGKALDELEQLLRDRESFEIQNQEHHVLVGVGARTLAQKKIGSAHPDYARVLAVRHPNEVTASKAALAAAVKRALLFAPEGIVRLRASAGVLTVDAENGDGSARDEVAVEMSGRPWAIAFNGRYLLNTFAAIDGDVRIQVRDADHHGVFMPVKETPGRSLHVVAPVRLPKTEVEPSSAGVASAAEEARA